MNANNRTEFQNDKQEKQFNGLMSGRSKVWAALANPNEMRMIAI